MKPGFFTNDVLAEVNPLGRLLFQGLWCHADREGRLHDRPKKLKVEILPYDECDVEKFLTELGTRNFIIRYEVGGVRYIQILNFTKHQNPHHMEVPSEIPPPPGHSNRFNHSPVTKDQRQKIFKRDGFTCLLCGAKDNLHIDHIVPVSKGGTSDDSNLRTLCETCNTKRGNRVDDEPSTVQAQVVDDVFTPADSLNPITSSLNPLDSTQHDVLHAEKLPLNTGDEFSFTENQCAEWGRLFPAVDVQQELRNMRGWLLANKRKRKTRNGIMKFATSWLSRAQDRPRPGNGSGRKTFADYQEVTSDTRAIDSSAKRMD